MIRVVDEDTYAAVQPDGSKDIRLQLHLDTLLTTGYRGVFTAATAIDLVVSRKVAAQIACALIAELAPSTV